MEPIQQCDIVRAQYDRREHRNDYQHSPRYDFKSDLAEHNGEYVYEVTVARKSDGHIYHHSFETDDAAVDEIFQDWWEQLEISSTDINMWGKS